ncbi:MAG: thermonuclease family protein [Patescibacteria group bacterium]
MDTPEKYPTRTGYAECYGEEASAFAVSAFSGNIVRLSRDASQDARDSYGRILANVFLPSGSLYAEKAAVSGYAFRYVYGGKPSLYDFRIKKAEASAKNKGLGVWGKCDGKRQPVSKPAAPSSKPVIVPAKKLPAPVITSSTPSFSCSTNKNVCAEMSSCSEAMFYLNSCGLGKLDRDKD